MAEKIEIYKEHLKSNNFNEILNIYFSEWENENCHRYFSWEYCYKFFLENKYTDFSTNTKLLDEACLNLGFYLASWGMYRGSSNLLWKDYTVHKDLIKCLCTNCRYLHEKLTVILLENAIDTIITCYQKHHGITATPTLITKVLMGIFGCVPAYDRFFIDGIRQYNKLTDISKLSTTFNYENVEKIKTFISNKITTKKCIKGTNIPYPQMKLIDSCFWVIGYELEKEKEKEKSQVIKI